MKTTKQQQTEYAVIQLGYGVHAVAKTLTGVKRVAKKWLGVESNSEIRSLDLSYSTNNKFDGDLVLVKCTRQLANIVRKNGGDVSFSIVDGVAIVE